MTVAVAHQVSKISRLALAEGAREAQHRGTSLAVLHAVESLDADRAEAYRLGISDEIERVVAGTEAQDVKWDLHLRVVAREGQLGDAILELAEQVGADLLVIGARRRSPVGKALLGSVAQTLILQAPMPVLVVKSA